MGRKTGECRKCGLPVLVFCFLPSGPGRLVGKQGQGTQGSKVNGLFSSHPERRGQRRRPPN